MYGLLQTTHEGMHYLTHTISTPPCYSTAMNSQTAIEKLKERGRKKRERTKKKYKKVRRARLVK